MNLNNNTNNTTQIIGSANTIMPAAPTVPTVSITAPSTNAMITINIKNNIISSTPFYNRGCNFREKEKSLKYQTLILKTIM